MDEKKKEEGAPLNLYQKIQGVANAVMSIEKDMTVGTGAYQYRAVSDISVTKAVKNAEKEFGLISIPVKQEIVHQEVLRIQERDKERITHSFLVKMTTRIVDLDKPEDFVEVETFGHGLDSGDKGFGKASTYARKYALLNAYKIATGEDPDSNPSEQQKGTPKPDEIKVAVLNYLNSDVKYIDNVLQNFNKGSLDELTEKEIATVYNALKTKGRLK
jgi:hypothetical protein